MRDAAAQALRDQHKSPTGDSIDLEKVAGKATLAMAPYPKALEVLGSLFDVGMDVAASDIARHYRLPKSAADYFIDRLLKDDLIERSDAELGVDESPKYAIAAAGREIVIRLRSAG